MVTKRAKIEQSYKDYGKELFEAACLIAATRYGNGSGGSIKRVVKDSFNLAELLVKEHLSRLDDEV